MNKNHNLFCALRKNFPADLDTTAISTAGNAVFTIRGFDQKPQHNGFVGESYVDTSSVERVEVVKGPSSVLYGQVAPGGTVNYITKRAQPKPFTAQAANTSSMASLSIK